MPASSSFTPKSPKGDFVTYSKLQDIFLLLSRTTGGQGVRTMVVETATVSD